MKKHCFLSPALILVILFLPFFAFPQYLLQEGYITTDLFEKANKDFTYKNLRIFPLTAGEYFLTAYSDIGTYTNLEKALKEKKIKITEKTSDSPNNQRGYNRDGTLNIDQSQQQTQENNSYSSDGEVNALFIENISTDTIFLMAGEVVKGGKQDRVLAQDIVLPPGSGQTELPVFCVEPHRWSYESSDKSFNEYYAVSTNSVRGKAVKDKDQHQVWEAVGEVMVMQGTETSTGTYTALEDSDDYTKKQEEYAAYFDKIFSKTEDCIGFVAISGDKIIGCDIFATPGLFEIQRTNIINSYIAEAIINGSEAKVGDKAVRDYLSEFLSTEVNQEEAISERGMQYEFRDRTIHVNTY